MSCAAGTPDDHAENDTIRPGVIGASKFPDLSVEYAAGRRADLALRGLNPVGRVVSGFCLQRVGSQDGGTHYAKYGSDDQ